MLLLYMSYVKKYRQRKKSGFIIDIFLFLTILLKQDDHQKHI